MTPDTTPLSQPPRWSLEPVVDHMADPYDATDWWLDQTPESEATVSAYFDHNAGHGQYSPSIKGFGFEEGGVTLFYHWSEVAEWTDRGAIARLERAYSEELNDV